MFLRLAALIAIAVLVGCSSESTDVTTAPLGDLATTAPIESADTTNTAPNAETAAPAPNPDAAAVTPFAITAGATAVDLADEVPALWTVTTGIDGVNVRANPGSASQFLGVYPPGQEGLATTGKRAELNGVEWKQIRFGGDGQLGWVAALHLRPAGAVLPETPVPAPPPVLAGRSECYGGGPGGAGYAARFDFSADGTAFTGGMRVDNGTTVEYRAIAASKMPPNPFTVTVRPIGGAERTEQWVFGIDGVELPGASVDLASCSEISAVIAEIDQQVTSYPAVPGS